jgi:CubicO group peptidase (beta-lactamase class C family)
LIGDEAGNRGIGPFSTSRTSHQMRVISIHSIGDRRTSLARILAVLVLLGTNVSSIRAADAPEHIDALLARYQELGLFNGSALVTDHGQLVLKKGYGLANMEWRIPNTPDTKFRLGSITKQFTATLVMQLVEQGKIDLNAPVTRYLPDYPRRTGDKVTIHHLLNHTSGIVGYTETPSFGATARNAYAPGKFIDESFSRLDLLFEPGTKFSYSNSGYFLLGAILEKVAGRPYETLLRERIFAPLGMNDSGYDSTQPLLSKRAAGYDRRFDGAYANTTYIDMTQPYSAGSLYSTVEDLYRWDQALYTERVLKDTSKERMFTPGLSNYGYGWTITTKDGATTIEHGGGINGFNTLITRNPGSKRLIVLLNNTGSAPLNQMADGIRAILDGHEPTIPKRPGAPMLLKTFQASGLAAALAQAKEMQAGSEYDAGDSELSRLAGQLLSTGNVVDGLELANTLAAESPRSAEAAVLLARAHRANGHRIEAVQAYSRAIELSATPRAFLLYTDAIRELSALEAKSAK